MACLLLKKQPPRTDGAPEGETDVTDHEFQERLRRLPPEVGILLLAVGFAGLALPGPVGSPFVVAGGLALWPKGFGKVENWFQKRFPGMHRKGRSQIERFLDDLENRYPGSVPRIAEERP